MSDTQTQPEKKDESQTSKLGLWKFILTGVCAAASIFFFATGNVTGGVTMATVAAQGGVSGMIGMKAQDAKK